MIGQQKHKFLGARLWVLLLCFSSLLVSSCFVKKIPKKVSVTDSSVVILKQPADTLVKVGINDSSVAQTDSISKKDSTGTNTKAEKNTTANSGALMDNTGSSFFTSELQSNLNDQINSKYTTKLLYDSIKVSTNKEFAYNSLTINNSSADSLNIQVVITSPKNWQMVTSNISNLSLEPYASTVIPIRLIPTSGNTSQWQDLRIEYRLNNITDSRKNYFRVRVQEYSGFKATLPSSSIVLTSFQRSISVPVFVRNSGNTDGTYTVIATNESLDVNSKTKFALAPGKDTTMMVTFSLNESKYHAMKKTEVHVMVKNEKEEAYSMVENISKVSDLIKNHPSAYLDMPVQMELGLMYQGPDAPAQYYAAVYGNVDLDDKNKLGIALKTNTIAKGQTNNNSIFRFDYSGEKWNAAIGNIQGVGEFVIDGYGVRGGYTWKGVNKAELYNMFSSRSGDNKVIGAAVQTGYKSTWRFNESFSMNMDQVKKMTSAIVNQIAEYKIKDGNGKISFITGFGMDHNRQKMVDSSKPYLFGSSFGYNFSYANKLFTINSNVLYNSNSYSGVFKGQRQQMHDVRLLYKKCFFGAFYEYNYRKQTFFQDTILFKDVFNSEVSNLGLRLGYQQRKGSVSMAIGNQKQHQGIDANANTNYDYINLSLSYLLAGKIQLNAVSFAGIMSVPGGDNKKEAFVTSNQGSIQYKKMGATFRIDDGPYFRQEFIAYIDSQQTYRKIMFNPFAEIRLFKKRLNGRLQANYARSLPNNITNTNFIANINYSHPLKGYDFNINGIIPVNSSQNVSSKPYINTTFRMRIKAPFLPVRKFYNLRLLLFKDANSNGVKEKEEEAIAGQTLSLNGDLLITDENGEITYKNTESGTYKTDFGQNSKLKGWIPNDGNIQYFELNSNRTIPVPYKVSRILTGKLNVQKDQLSDVPFNLSNIKVMVAGDKGEVNSTLTDESGEFHFNLPSGKYIVSLSEGAFGDQFRPTEFSQPADLVNNQTVTLYFEIKQKRRQINIKKAAGSVNDTTHKKAVDTTHQTIAPITKMEIKPKVDTIKKIPVKEVPVKQPQVVETPKKSIKELNPIKKEKKSKEHKKKATKQKLHQPKKLVKKKALKAKKAILRKAKNSKKSMPHQKHTVLKGKTKKRIKHHH